MWTLLPSFSSSLSSPFPTQSRGCAQRLDTANRDAARAQRSLKMAPPRVPWIYPSLPLLSSLLLVFHASPPSTALRNYPENEGGCASLREGVEWDDLGVRAPCRRRMGSPIIPAVPLPGEGAERSAALRGGTNSR